MAEVVIHAIPEPGTDPAEVSAELEAFLHDASDLAPVLVEVEQPRLGLAEILAIVQIASGVVEVTEKLIGFLKSRQAKGKVKDIEVEIDGQRVPVRDLTPDQRARLAAAIAHET